METEIVTENPKETKFIKNFCPSSQGDVCQTLHCVIFLSSN